jgi:small conductance mechanosensitive channel
MTPAPRQSRIRRERRPARPRTTRRTGRGARRFLPTREYHQRAVRQLQRYRQGTALATALTALVLLVWDGPLPVEGAEQAAEAAAAQIASDPGAAVDQATATIRDLARGFYGFLPRLAIVALLMLAAALISRVVQAGFRRTAGGWQRAEAASAITRLVVYLAATVAALSVLAGDARAVVGSVGLLGLAASWALQTPIESFTGWLLNAFRHYYRVGDRIAVGEVFGDVYRIDVLTTTVWEAGGSGKAVTAAQATGALITFPNWEVLRSNIVNYTRDFPYVWDEVTIGVANESDLAYAARVIEDTVREVLGSEMADATARYERILEREGLTFEVEQLPRVYLSLADSWTACTVRYVVPVRARRHWSSTLVVAITAAIGRPEHAGRIIPVYPRTEITIHREWPKQH